MNVIRFAPLREEHIALIQEWLKRPHVSEFWQEPQCDTLDKLREKYLEQLPQRGVRAFVLLLHEVPAGYFQYYQAARVGGGWWPNSPETLFGIDQFIGEAELLGKNLGTEAISKFLELLFATENAAEVISDPEPSNERMIHVYEKLGFRREKEISTPGGSALLLRLQRAEFSPYIRKG